MYMYMYESEYVVVVVVVSRVKKKKVTISNFYRGAVAGDKQSVASAAFVAGGGAKLPFWA